LPDLRALVEYQCSPEDEEAPMTTFPEPQQDRYDLGVDLVRLFHDEFGTTAETIRNQIVQGEIKIDDEDWMPDDGKATSKLFVPVDVLTDGKTVEVVGPDRRWRMKYRTPKG
jgi:hypothetical protein